MENLDAIKAKTRGFIDYFFDRITLRLEMPVRITGNGETWRRRRVTRSLSRSGIREN